MQRRSKIFIALGAAGILGFIAVADSAFADRKRGHQGYHGGSNHAMMARHGGPRHGTSARQFRSLAERYDLNQDGEITQDEIDRNRAEWHAEFAGDDGAMTLEQFQDLWLRARQRQMVREFQRFDIDGDGRITLEEYQRPMSDLVERLDRTGSQSLSRDDFQRRGKMQRRGQRGTSDSGSRTE